MSTQAAAWAAARGSLRAFRGVASLILGDLETLGMDRLHSMQCSVCEIGCGSADQRVVAGGEQVSFGTMLRF